MIFKATLHTETIARSLVEDGSVNDVADMLNAIASELGDVSPKEAKAIASAMDDSAAEVLGEILRAFEGLEKKTC